MLNDSKKSVFQLCLDICQCNNSGFARMLAMAAVLFFCSSLPVEAAMEIENLDKGLATELDSQFFSLDSQDAYRTGKTGTGRQLLEDYSPESLFFQGGSQSQALDFARAGHFHLKNGDKEQGLQFLERAWEIDPSLAAAGVLIAYTHLQTGNYVKVLDVAKRLQSILFLEQQWNHSLTETAYGGLTLQQVAYVSHTLQGVAYGMQGDRERSKVAFKEALEVVPGDPDASGSLAEYALSEGNFDQARALYEGALDNNPGHLTMMLKLSELEARAGNTERATMLLGQAGEANPLAPEPRVIMARQQINANKPLEALRSVESIRERFEDSAEVLEVLGRAELMSGDTDAAVGTLSQWVEVQPDAPLPHFYLASALEKQGLTAQAIGELDIVLHLTPQHAPAKFSKARLLAKSGKLSEADNLLRELEEAHPENPAAVVSELRGKIAMANNNPVEAITHFNTALRASKNNFLTIQLAMAQMRAGKTEESVMTLQSWLEDYQSDNLTRIVLAQMLSAQGMFDEARQQYEEIVRQQPENIRALNNLAWLLANKGELDAALGYAEKAHDLAPNNPQVTDTLGVILLRKGHTEKAVSLLQTATASSPDALGIRFHLAQAHAGMGHTDEAKKQLKELLVQDRSFKERDQAQDLLDELEAK